MSTSALQRFIVRLMFDATLVRRLSHRPEQALKGVDLSDDERRWLLGSDMRAYGSDPLFAPRLLHAVVGECVVASSIALAHGGGQSRTLLPFFQSPGAHGAVQRGESLALAFADWLISRVAAGRWRDARIAEVARLERALASLRRPGDGQGALHSCANLVKTRVNTWAVYNEGLVKLRLHGDETTAALEGRLHLEELPRLLAGSEWVLCQTTERSTHGSAGIEVLPDALAELIRIASDGASRGDLLARARNLGAESGEDEAIIAELERDRIIAFPKYVSAVVG